MVYWAWVLFGRLLLQLNVKSYDISFVYGLLTVRWVGYKWCVPRSTVHFKLRPSSSMNGSVRPSACLSVRLSACLSLTPFWLCSHQGIITKFSGAITNDRSDVHVKGQGHRSEVKVTEVINHLDRFRIVTPVWIHIWWWNDAQSLMLLGRGALLFFKVIRQISRSHC